MAALLRRRKMITLKPSVARTENAAEQMAEAQTPPPVAENQTPDKSGAPKTIICPNCG